MGAARRIKYKMCARMNEWKHLAVVDVLVLQVDRASREFIDVKLISRGTAPCTGREQLHRSIVWTDCHLLCVIALY